MEKKRVVRKVSDKPVGEVIGNFVEKSVEDIPKKDQLAYVQDMVKDLIMWERTAKEATETLKRKKAYAVKLLQGTGVTDMSIDGGKAMLVQPESKELNEKKIFDSLTAEERANLTTFKFDPTKFQNLVSTGAIPSVYAELAKVEEIDSDALSKAMTKDTNFANRMTECIEITKKTAYVKVTYEK